MKIPHAVIARVKAHEGSLSNKEGDMPLMHSIGAMKSKCPRCGKDREFCFRRQATSAEGHLYMWVEFKCFEERCRVVWVEVFKLVPIPYEPQPN